MTKLAAIDYAAFARAVRRDCAAMQCHQVPGQGQADAQAALRHARGAVDLHEHAEHRLKHVQWDAHAIVAYANLDALADAGD